VGGNHTCSRNTASDKVTITNDWKEKITFPPVNPNRVLNEQYLRKRETGNRHSEKTIHKKRRSTENQWNRVTERTDAG
jgi:hypothetical protein